MEREKKLGNMGRYTYRVSWSEDDGYYIATCLEFPSLSGHGETLNDALNDIISVVEESVAWMMEDSEDIPEPFSVRIFKGNIPLRIPPETHRRIAMLAAESGISLNQFITSLVESTCEVNHLSKKLVQLDAKIDVLQSSIRDYEHMLFSHLSGSTATVFACVEDLANTYRIASTTIRVGSVPGRFMKYWPDEHRESEVSDAMPKLVETRD